MKRGFIFSLDAMLAVLLLVIIAAAYANVSENNNTQLKIAGLKADVAMDKVITGFYSGNVGETTSTGANSSCVEWWDYKIALGSGQTLPIKRTICEGFS